MVKGDSPGVYSATYSGIPVYEFQFGVDLKEHVMRRRHDDWVNATHVLKAAGFDKPARTRILERDVQKDTHEKIQGGYGKYQGTWIPMPAAESLAVRHSVYDSLRPIFEFRPGNESPPPAPKHASKPKAPKSKPPIPKWNIEEYDNTADSTMMGEDDTPDNLTVASASYMGEEDRFDMSHVSTGHRKRKREEQIHDLTEQQHALYGDELLDYFLLSHNEQPAVKPDPPPNFQPNWLIDAENHTALHWASAMGDVDVIKQLKRFSADISARNIRGETPLMRALNFTNCFEKQSFPAVMDELFETADARDHQGCTVIHHAAIMKNGRVYSHPCSRYYLDSILNRLQGELDPNAFQLLVDAQSNDGNTALHLAAYRNARKCIRSLLGRNASSDIPNNEGVRAEDLIMELNANKKDRGHQRSSSPFAPDSHKHVSFRDAFADKGAAKKTSVSFSSAAANTVHNRISPLILDKFQDLAKSYEDEWQQKDVAEAEARRILSNSQTDLNVARQQIAELEAQLETDDAAARLMNEANIAKHQVLELIAHQNRLHVQHTVDAELSKANGDAATAATAQEDTYEEKLDLARQLGQLLAEQRQVESEYVDALSMVGTGDKIEKYRKLLKRCLDPRDEESLDSNLDSLIDMMEEQKDVHDLDGLPGAEPVDVHV
ncbi:KilA-N domain [Geosmithia morbida]|uniref:KilA-N domain n=1 Tax=Geosmithia morbida TaxID=1094350 RepID=A0A9P4YQZ8_9HYPO|nr:KilA-N domain [Geosmithia morbida]KAF4120088.1 KilA-N domain [Geosmithia morbida]